VGTDALTTAPKLVYSAEPDNTREGEYTITPSEASAGGNYTINYETGTLIISEKPIAQITKAPEAICPAYTGKAQALVTAGEATGGTMNYVIRESCETAPTDGWSEKIPEAEEAGTYYVWYKAAGDKDHSDSDTDYCEAKILKTDDPAVINDTAVVTAGGNTVDLAANVTGAVGEVSCAIDGEANGCTLKGSALTSGNTAGTCRVRVTVADSKNHFGKTGTITVTITAPEAEPEPEPESKPEPEPDNKPDNKPDPVTPEEKVEDFITRCYRLILGRAPDAEGMKNWTDILLNRKAPASSIVRDFLLSREYREKNRSNAETVELLYQLMLNRKSDAEGKQFWLGLLDAGKDLTVIINGFFGSKEFIPFYLKYNITNDVIPADGGGEKPARQPVDVVKTKALVARFYRELLGREAEKSGFEEWMDELVTGKLTGAGLINGFMISEEFAALRLSPSQVIDRLYRAMLNREADADGKQHWLALLEAGNPIGVVINGFCDSEEFRAICMDCGILAGKLAVAAVTEYAEPEEETEVSADGEETTETGEEVPAAEGENAAPVSETETNNAAPAPETENAAPAAETENAAPANEPEAGNSAPAVNQDDPAHRFVAHCYRSALGREGSAEEVDYYAGQITSGQKTAKEIAGAFAFSQELRSKGLENMAYIRILYRLCLGREADAEGLTAWMENMANGETPEAVFIDFTETAEFIQFCSGYGIPSGATGNGTVTAPAGEDGEDDDEETEAGPDGEPEGTTGAPASEYANEGKIREFVSRFYRSAMGREPDEGGLAYYAGRILNGQATPKDVAREIICSEEFRNRMPDNEELVRILYRVYLGREADEEGLAGWVEQLEDGASLEDIMNGFAVSEEFRTVVNGLK
jgi:acylphosphatase